jgi:hypothetical protein
MEMPGMETRRETCGLITALGCAGFCFVLLIGILVACGGGATTSSPSSSAPSSSASSSGEQPLPSESATSPPTESSSEILPAEGSYALVYDGPVAAEGAADAVAAVVEDIGLPVTFISDIFELPEFLEDAAVFIIGGTEDDLSPLFNAFTPEVDVALRDYLQRGGRYLGICGGAYLASSGWDEYGTWVRMLGIIPAESGILDDNEEPRILPIDWLGETYQMYFQYGPTFILTPTSQDVRTIAYYSDGDIAALLSSYGRGKVAVSGPHPEAEDDWADEAVNGEDWTSTTMLLVDLLEELLSGDPVNP